MLAVCGILFIVKFPHCGLYGWLSRFPHKGSLCRCSDGWGCISSLWSAMKCPVVCFAMSVGLE